LENVVDGLELISVADIFIGGGGTMTAESALLGKPTISISPIKFYVDDYLVKTSLIYKIKNPAQIVKTLRRIKSDNLFRLRQKNRAQHILNRMEDPANKLLKIIGKFVSL